MRKAIGITVVLVTLVLVAGEAFAQKSRTCTTTCYGGGDYKRCTRSCT